MSVAEATRSTAAEMRETLRELQSETIALVYPALFLGGAILLGAARHFEQPTDLGLAALVLILLPAIVYVVHLRRYMAAAWVLLIGSLMAILLLIWWANVGLAIFLLPLSVGLATLYIGAGAGLLVAALCTAVLMGAPVPSLPDSAARTIAAVGVWGTLGITWVSLRRFLTPLGWFSTTYEKNLVLLEDARDTQMQLRQTLEDLEDANTQLTRMNRLAQGLRRAADDARTAKERFVANVSHELRTPLNMIVGFSDMIMRASDLYGGNVSPKLLTDLEVILRNSRHLSRLIDDVLDLSQVAADQMALAREYVSLREIVEAAMTAVRPLFESKRLELSADLPTDLPPIYCDGTRIRQVVLNLLSNAGRYTERGEVRVGAWREGESIVVSVADTGPGISQDARDKLFQPFHQLENIGGFSVWGKRAGVEH